MTELTISRSSWLGKYYELICGFPPMLGWRQNEDHRWNNLNLCTFVQRLVWLTVGKLLLWSALAALVVGALYCMGFVPYWCIRYGFPVEHPPARFLLGIGAWIVAVIIGAVALKEWISASFWWHMRQERKWQKRRDESREKSAEKRQPSIAWAWLKAKKQKVCPLIKVVD